MEKVAFSSPVTRAIQRRSPSSVSFSTAATVGFSASCSASHVVDEPLERDQLLRRGRRRGIVHGHSTRARACRSP